MFPQTKIHMSHKHMLKLAEIQRIYRDQKYRPKGRKRPILSKAQIGENWLLFARNVLATS